jgi:hypothetical protein
MRHLKRKATEILESEDLSRLLSACTDEVTSTIHRIEEGWRLREAARDSLPSSHQGYMAYADLGVCLAAVETQLRGQILRMDVVNDIDRDVGEAVRKLHGGLIGSPACSVTAVFIGRCGKNELSTGKQGVSPATRR